MIVAVDLSEFSKSLAETLPRKDPRISMRGGVMGPSGDNQDQVPGEAEREHYAHKVWSVGA